MLAHRRSIFLPIILVGLLLFFTVKGSVGSDLHHAINEAKRGYSMESSISRGRYALIMNLVNFHTLQFDSDMVRFAYPDVAIIGSKKSSIFPPGVAFFLIPWYVVGKLADMGQLATSFGVMTITIINTYLLFQIFRKLGSTNKFALLFSVINLFATATFVYASIISQHQFSTLFLLITLYSLISFSSFTSFGLITGLVVVAFFIDAPLVILLMPFVVGSLYLVLQDKKLRNRLKTSWLIPGIVILTLFVACVEAMYNFRANGNPLLIGQWARSVTKIADGIPVLGTHLNAYLPFKSHNVLHGLWVLLLSPERGIVYFSPIFILLVFGVQRFFIRYRSIAIMSFLSIVLTILLYASFGDAAGGPSFGPRYLIPLFPMFTVFLAYTFQKYRKNIFFQSAFILLLVYSVVLNALGAVGSTGIETSFGSLYIPTGLLRILSVNNEITSGIFVVRLAGMHISVFSYWAFIVLLEGALLLPLIWSVLQRKEHANY